MRHALVLAARALGRVAPNPAVGCVIVTTDGRIVGRGATQDGGRPHAEAIALKQAGSRARGATAYVTLEPCSHHGRTPPCVEALIGSGIARLVVAMTDPDPRVNGRGFALLREAGIEVTSNLLHGEASALNLGFVLKTTEGRPLVTLKIAQSADGKTSRAPGRGPWITGEDARRFGQLMRARHDAILVGIDTVVTDDPELTCRISGLEKYSPLRVVLDTNLRLEPWAKLSKTARDVPTVVFTTADGGDALRALGVTVIHVAPDANERVSIAAVLEELAVRGVTRLLVEGGAVVHSAFLRAGFADRLEIFTAPFALGMEGRGLVEGLADAKAGEALKFLRISSRSFGQDRLESYAARP